MAYSETTHQAPARTGGLEGSDPLKILIAIFLPPVGVFMEVGLGFQFWVNVVLTILGYIPGIIHALYIILTR
ncbi:MAG: YqaE/Pmp3 family membrane protein [Phycisphaerae bacterium]